MCVIERTKLENVADIAWFNIFSLSKWKVSYSLLSDVVLTSLAKAFETVSAYGTVGLSLGIPTVRRCTIPDLPIFPTHSRQIIRSLDRFSQDPSSSYVL